jgi:hypothetical protein
MVIISSALRFIISIHFALLCSTPPARWLQSPCKLRRSIHAVFFGAGDRNKNAIAI